MSKRIFLHLLFVIILSYRSILSYGYDVIFRLDDPSLSKSGFTTKIVQLFAQHNIPLSIGVVSCTQDENPISPLDTTLIDYLENNGSFEICIHGLNHRKHDEYGEFFRIGKNEAKRRIEKAISIIGPISPNNINTFIPPHNAIDRDSIEELREYCSIISSDMFCKDYSDGIDFYPETLGHLADKMSVWDVAKEILERKYEKKAICVIMFHEYDLKEDLEWNKLSSLLDFCKNNDNISTHTFSSLQRIGNHSSSKRIKANQFDSGLKKLILQDGVLHTTVLCYLTHIANGLLFAIAALLFLIPLIRIRKPISIPTKISYSLLAIVAFIMAIFHILGPLKLLAMVLCLSALIFMAILISSKERKH